MGAAEADRRGRWSWLRRLPRLYARLFTVYAGVLIPVYLVLLTTGVFHSWWSMSFLASVGAVALPASGWLRVKRPWDLVCSLFGFVTVATVAYAIVAGPLGPDWGSRLFCVSVAQLGLGAGARREKRRLAAVAAPTTPPCAHADAVPVELASGGERVAWLCPACDEQLPADWAPSFTDLHFNESLLRRPVKAHADPHLIDWAGTRGGRKRSRRSPSKGGCIAGDVTVDEMGPVPEVLTRPGLGGGNCVRSKEFGRLGESCVFHSEGDPNCAVHPPSTYLVTETPTTPPPPEKPPVVNGTLRDSVLAALDEFAARDADRMVIEVRRRPFTGEERDGG